MSLAGGRACVFCGGVPDAKTNEHVVPKWAIEMTGDPRRVVTFGQDFSKGKKPIRFSWSAFAAPACNACNEKFAKLEDQTKPIVEALQRREALPVSDYLVLLDWLDKVRVGIWLLRHSIERHPVVIDPNFHISSRVAQKDRMVAVYIFEDDGLGLNVFGSDSLIFNGMPSCAGVRINNLLLLSVSSDFFCSAGCGFPHPARMTFQMDGEHKGKLVFDEFKLPTERSSGVSHPVTDLPLFKPVVWLYQPIAMPTDDPAFQGGFIGHWCLVDTRLESLKLEGNRRQGALFRQYQDRVEVLRHLSERIEFDEVVGSDEAVRGDIIATIYDTQVRLYKSYTRSWTDDRSPRDFAEAYGAVKMENAEGLAAMYRASVADRRR